MFTSVLLVHIEVPQTKQAYYSPSPCGVFVEYSFKGGFQVKNWPAIQETQETQVPPLGWEDPLEEDVTPIPVFSPGDFHGRRSLAGYSPEGRKESDMPEAPEHAHVAKLPLS